MTQILRIPKVAVSMREGTLVAWLVADGSTVQEGQPIFTLDLEKSTMDVEAPAAGVIRQTGQAGTTYKVGEIIGEIGAPAAPEADVLRLDFRLTAGSFATSVIEQLMRVDGTGDEGAEGA